MSPKAPQAFRKLSRRDLRSFKPEGVRMVLAAMTVPEAVGRVSARGHAIIRGPEGGTFSVSPSAQPWNRGIKNTEANFKVVLGMTVEEAERMASRKATSEPEASSVVAAAEAPRTPLLCPAKDCGKTFPTEGARYAHITAEHIRCRDVNCVWVSPNGDYKGRFVAKNEQSENLHYQRSHGGLQGQVKRRVAATTTAEPDTKTVTVRHTTPKRKTVPPSPEKVPYRVKGGTTEIEVPTVTPEPELEVSDEPLEMDVADEPQGSWADPDYKVWGDRIRETRLDRGMSVLQLAQKSGVAENTVRRIEGGTRINPSNLRMVTNALGLDKNTGEPTEQPVPAFTGNLTETSTAELHSMISAATAELRRRADVATDGEDYKKKFEDLETKVSMIREVWEL